MLPSYADATSHDHWNIIAPYISSSELCSAALVCGRWHEIFAPHLWGNPASHFSLENDAVYVALTKFKRTLPLARYYVRQLTHTLHLPPAHAEIYQGPHADWLLTVLRQLPNLQCLVVDRLPFFDHAALLYLRRAVTTVGGSSVAPAEFSVRLLNASGCTNATHLGLSESLQHFTGLVYLDFSRTPTARHAIVLQSFAMLPNLQVLKMRGVGLTDVDIEILGPRIGLHIRSLDVRDNALTDISAKSLLTHCCKYALPSEASIDLQARGAAWRAPAVQGQDTLSSFEGVDMNSLIQNRLLSGLPYGLAVEDSAKAGLTHLFISGNKFTAAAMCNLLQTSNIQVLDAGEVYTEASGTSSPSEQGSAHRNRADLLANDDFMPLVRRCCGGTMNYLRVNHSAVTGCINWNTHDIVVAELQGNLGRYAPPHALELESNPRKWPAELQAADVGKAPPCDGPNHVEPPGEEKESPSGEPQHIFELPGDIPDPTFTRAIKRLEVNGNSEKQNHDVPSLVVNEGGGPVVDESVHDLPLRPRSWSSAKHKREAFVAGQKTTAPFLSPVILPKLRVLALVGVPERAEVQRVADRLINLIQCCASLVILARAEAKHSYHQPPGRSNRSYEREYVKSIIALEKIVIEIAEPEMEAGHKASWRKQTGKSSTEDQDSDAFWTAAENDFTFFDEDECGLPVEKQQGRFFTDHKIAMSEDEEKSRRQAAQARRQSANEENPTYDVISRLAAFRQNRKQAYLTAVERGVGDPDIEGYWPGEIQVVRPHLDQNRSRDWYGNRFEKGYLYR